MKIEKDKQSIAKIKVGDRVWTQFHDSPPVINLVTRTTPARICLGPNISDHYWKEDSVRPPRHYAGNHIGTTGSILRIATPEECAQWDREQEARREKYKTEQNKREAHTRLLDQLTELFGNPNIRVRDSEFGARGTYDIVISDLTESQVRQIRIETHSTVSFESNLSPLSEV
jgi:hypothetical protein